VGIAKLAARLTQTGFCCDFVAALNVLAKVLGPLNGSLGTPKGFNLSGWESGSDSHEERQKRRMTPPLATTLCWVLEFNLTFRSGLPERKSRTSALKPMKRKTLKSNPPP